MKRARKISEKELDAIRLRLGNGDSCVRVEAEHLGITTAELKRALYPFYAPARHA